MRKEDIRAKGHGMARGVRELAVPMFLMLVVVSISRLMVSHKKLMVTRLEMTVLEKLSSNVSEPGLGLTSDTRNSQIFPETPTNSTTERSSLLGVKTSDNATKGVSAKNLDKDGTQIDNGSGTKEWSSKKNASTGSTSEKKIADRRYRNKIDHDGGMKEQLSRKNTTYDSTVPIKFDLHDRGDNPAPILWTCGYLTSTLFYLLFPEYRASQVIKFSKSNANYSIKSDVMVNGLTGNCGGWGKNKLGPKWISENFKGIALYVNGEPIGGSLWEAGNSPPDRGYHIGYVPDSIQSVRVLYLVQRFSQLPHNWENIFNHHRKPMNTQEEFLIYTNSHCVPFREEAVVALAAKNISIVHYGGGCYGAKDHRNKHKLIQSSPWVPTNTKILFNLINSNADWMNRYRFCLVMENSKVDGYITEKILNAFLAGCIPIYYGTNEIFRIFNRDAFIYYDIENPEPALSRVAYLESNHSAYMDALTAPILANGTDTIEEYFSLVDGMGNGTLKEKIRTTMGFSNKKI